MEPADLHIKKAEKKLKSARHSFEGEFYEDAISRAYYAMYHAAKAILGSKEIYPRTHAGVISMFGLHLVNTGFVEDLYGRAIARAEESREDADYDIYFEPTRDEAEEVIKDAGEFLERIEKALREMRKKDE